MHQVIIIPDTHGWRPFMRNLRDSTRLFLLSETASIFHVMFLLALCGALYFPYLSSIPFFDKGEPQEALAVHDIVQRGEWLGRSARHRYSIQTAIVSLVRRIGFAVDRFAD